MTEHESETHVFDAALCNPILQQDGLSEARGDERSEVAANVAAVCGPISIGPSSIHMHVHGTSSYPFCRVSILH